MRKRTLKKIFILTIGTAALYLAYELQLKFVINEYQISRIEDRLQRNFFEHSEELAELSNYVLQFKDFNLAIRPSNELQISITDTTSRKEDERYFLVENDSVRFLGLTFEPGNLEQVISKSILFDTLEIPKWRIEYRGEAKSEIASLMLSSRGIHDKDVVAIINKLELVNSIGITRNEQWVKIRYRGFNWDSFNYVYPLFDCEPASEWNYLANNFYWEHYEFGLYCGWTDWGWY